MAASVWMSPYSTRPSVVSMRDRCPLTMPVLTLGAPGQSQW